MQVNRERNFETLLMDMPLQYPGIASVPGPLLYLAGCGKFDQFCCTLRGLIDPEKYCPFCPQERERRGRQTSATIGNWALLQNEFPRKGTKQMWLILPNRHVKNISGLSVGDWADIARLVHHCIDANHIDGGGIVCRFGDPHYNVGTIEHLHINIIEPTPGKEYAAPFAKDEGRHAENYQRMLDFRDEMIKQGGINWLFSADGLRETRPIA